MKEVKIQISFLGIPFRKTSLPYNKEVVLDSRMESETFTNGFWIVGPRLRVRHIDGTLMTKGVDHAINPPQIKTAHFPLSTVNDAEIGSGGILKRRIVVRETY